MCLNIKEQLWGKKKKKKEGKSKGVMDYWALNRVMYLCENMRAVHGEENYLLR